MFFSTSHIGFESNANALLKMAHVMSIDVTSAFFVLTGFVGAYVHNSMSIEEYTNFCVVLWSFIMTDVWVATFVSIIMGTVFTLSRGRFHCVDLILTVLELSLIHI